MKLGKRNSKSNTLNRDWLKPVNAAKWPMYSDFGSLISAVLFYYSAFMHYPIDQFLIDHLVFSTIEV